MLWRLLSRWDIQSRLLLVHLVLLGRVISAFVATEISNVKVFLRKVSFIMVLVRSLLN